MAPRTIRTRMDCHVPEHRERGTFEIDATDLDGPGLVKRLADATGHAWDYLDLTGTYFAQANLSQITADYADFSRAILNDAIIEDATFTYAQLDKIFLAHAKFRQVNFAGARLHEANLTYASGRAINFSGAELNRARLSHVRFYELSAYRGTFVGANLNDAFLPEAYFNSANMYNASFKNTNLTRANLSYADLSFCDFRGAILAGTSLHGATLTGAKLAGSRFLNTAQHPRIRPLHVPGSGPHAVGVFAAYDKTERLLTLGAHSFRLEEAACPGFLETTQAEALSPEEKTFFSSKRDLILRDADYLCGQI